MFIVGKMIEGDRDAFKYFFDQYYTDLCNFVLLYVKDKVLAEEVVQDIFVYFWESRNKLNISSSVRAYLFSASKYKSLIWIRDREPGETLESSPKPIRNAKFRKELLFAKS